MAWTDENIRMKEAVEFILFNKKGSIDVSVMPTERLDSLEPGESRDLMGYGFDIDFEPVSISLLASGAEVSFGPVKITSGC